MDHDRGAKFDHQSEIRPAKFLARAFRGMGDEVLHSIQAKFSAADKTHPGTLELVHSTSTGHDYLRFATTDGVSDFVVAVDEPIEFDFDDASGFHAKLALSQAEEAKREEAEIACVLQKLAPIAAMQKALLEITHESLPLLKADPEAVRVARTVAGARREPSFDHRTPGRTRSERTTIRGVLLGGVERMARDDSAGLR
jgi:hypothetical protein